MFSILIVIIYLSFISLGLPDSLLGSSWPAMYPQLNVPVSYAGIISMTIALCTVFSSLMSDRVTRRFGTGRVTAVSVATTALALMAWMHERMLKKRKMRETLSDTAHYPGDCGLTNVVK